MVPGQHLKITLDVHLRKLNFGIRTTTELAPQHLLRLSEVGLLSLEHARQPFKKQLFPCDNFLPHLLKELSDLVTLPPGLAFSLPEAPFNGEYLRLEYGLVRSDSVRHLLGTGSLGCSRLFWLAESVAAVLLEDAVNAQQLLAVFTVGLDLAARVDAALGGRALVSSLVRRCLPLARCGGSRPLEVITVEVRATQHNMRLLPCLVHFPIGAQLHILRVAGHLGEVFRKVERGFIDTGDMSEGAGRLRRV